MWIIKTGFMDTSSPSGQYHGFLQRLKAYLERSRLHYSEQKIGGTTVLYVSRKSPGAAPAPQDAKKEKKKD